MPYSDSQYLDPIHIVWRDGSTSDPYVEKTEYLKVVNQTIVLNEIPDKVFRVRIQGLVEVNADSIKVSALVANQFSVNYATGVIQVHKDMEGKTLNVFYKGRGFIQYPSDRIYHQDKFNNVILTLNDIIDKSLESVESLNIKVDSKIADYKEIRDVVVQKISEAILATENSIQATDKTDIATKKALDAYNTTRLVFLKYVDTFDEVGIKYPSPQVGWTVQVYDTGIRYRYDGIEWLPIDLFGGNLQPATELKDGLMSKEHLTKLIKVGKDLDELEEVVDKLGSKPQEKVIVFCYPYLNAGANSIIARFPFTGDIKSIKAICSKVPSDVFTEIDIEKSTDMLIWDSILDDSFVTFDLSSNFDNGNHVVLKSGVEADDLFRINVKTLSTTIEGVTIEIKIEI